ncbi:MAG: DUF692 domain-containing protein [Brevundimonas sp.]|uniref:MNIO family bufferin maturase n=1 Tax=Brevundimonas sp. TaxID=1871086 RepID=UPI002777C6AF|nr:DUF692 domain-containing protein [Brevundimonas sp.]MDP3399823.1 DUF692 domain-containing protein [Brevundimonas sp.]MDZ4108534.1 DUF692 domain-containing protein [Brevundimonas sp.]
MAPTAGLGLKPQHYAEAAACPAAGSARALWFEVHPENYMVEGGPRLSWLETIRATRPLSLHGVGLSLAGDERPDAGHLARFRTLIDRYEPFVVSEHLAWSRRGGVYHPDLLPIPRNAEMLSRVCAHIDEAQEALGRRLLIENPTAYLALADHQWDEVEFLVEIARRTGCGLLVDVNNVYVSAANMGLSAEAWIDRVPGALVGEIHLAGHRPDPVLGDALLIDSHDAPVAELVWALHRRLIERIGPRPTLIERDGQVPGFSELLAEQARAATVLLDLEMAA